MSLGTWGNDTTSAHTERENPMDKQTYAIGCLSLSAVILLAGLFVVGALETQRAEASDMLSTAGPYILLTGAVSTTNDLVYLIDTRKGVMVVYKLNETTHVIERTDFLDFGDAPDDAYKRPRPKP